MNAQDRRLHGVFHIMITPFDEAQRIDQDSLARVVRAAEDAGCAGVVPLGIMGEAHKLTDAERREVLDGVAAAITNPETAIVAGVSAESTAVAVARAEDAAAAGAQYVMLAPPRNAAVGPGLVSHYRAVAEATDLPVVVQDEPVTTGVKLPGSFFAEVGDVPGIVAAKVEEVPSPQKVTTIKNAAPHLICHGGLGGMSMYEELARGADGIMTGFGFPEILVEIYRAYVDGDPQKSREIFHHYLPLIRFEAQLGVGGVAIRKHLFHLRGIIDCPIVRQPAAPVDEQTSAELKDLVELLGLSK